MHDTLSEVAATAAALRRAGAQRFDSSASILDPSPAQSASELISDLTFELYIQPDRRKMHIYLPTTA